MKAVKILSLAAALSLAVNSMASAVGVVWFEAQAMTPNGTSDGLQGDGLGRGLKVDCDVTQGLRCDWLVTVFYQNFDGGAFGWALDVGTLEDSDGKLLIKEINVPTSPLATTVDPGFLNNELEFTPGSLILNANGNNPTGAPAGTYLLMQFVLSKNKRPGEFQQTSIYAGVGLSEFGGNDTGGGYELISIGGSQQFEGSNGEFWPDNALTDSPILVINNVPEPATIGLLGLGLLTLVRRRR